MKIVHKMYLANAVNIGLIVVIGAFAFHTFNELMMKFRFAEIADDLNTAFLEMRLAEKNYFLYGGTEALLSIKKRLTETIPTLSGEKEEIIQVVGKANHDRLVELLSDYGRNVYEFIDKQRDEDSILSLRESGQKLRSFSENITKMEREKVATIIENSKSVLRFSFWSVMIFAFFFAKLSARSIRRSLRQIVALTRSISKGNYSAIKETPSADEMGSVVLAINAMSEELNRREEEIIRSKRLASIGVLVAGVAHELNNPLNNISMIAQTFLEVHDNLGKEQRLEFMQQVEDETERLRLTIKNLLDFSKPKEKHLTTRDINDVVQKSLDLVGNMLGISNIQTQLSLADGLPNLCIDEHQIQQVFVNMMINAIQAMKPGDKLALITRAPQPADKVEVEIGDTGKGIAPEFLDHIFDPFFTTKEDGGTGLGLWVSYGIIKNHGGDIRVQSTVDVGTTFTITLPTTLERCNHDKA